MTRLTLANRISVKLAAVVFVAAFIVVPCHAQTQDFRNHGQRALAVCGCGRLLGP